MEPPFLHTGNSSRVSTARFCPRDEECLCLLALDKWMASTERYSASINNVEADSMRGPVSPFPDDGWVLRTK